MLDELITAIEKAKQTIQEHKQSLAKSEIRTRLVLIDPILRVLGWDVTDPHIVKIEYNLQSFPNQQVDYALCNGDETVVFVEAKKLNEPLHNHVRQMLYYAVGDGIKYAVLTDGNLWEMYDVFKELPFNDKRILDIDLSSSHTITSAFNFLRLWRLLPNSYELSETPKPIIAPIDPPPNGDTLSGDWIEFSNYYPESGSKPPTQIQFKDGPTVSVQFWNEMLIESARRANSIGRLTKADVPLGVTSRRYYIHTKPNHPDGTKFYSPRSIKSTRFVIEAHGNASTMVRRVKHLWNHLGLPLSDITVKLIADQ